MRLRNKMDRMHASYTIPPSGGQANYIATMVIVGAMGVFVFAYLCKTLGAQPLFPFQNENLEWCRYGAPFHFSVASPSFLTAPPLFFVTGMCKRLWITCAELGCT